MAKDFTLIFNQARVAAQAAGDAWIAKHTQPKYIVKDGTGRAVGEMLDLCGRWYVETKLNTAFGRWIAKRSQGGVSKWIHFGINHEYRQEMGLHQAMAEAALKVLEDGGIEGLTLYSWVD